MSKVVWHQTSSGITLFWDGASLIIPTDHPLYTEVHALISSQEEKMDRLREIVGEHKASLDQKRVESLLGIQKAKT